MGATLASIDRVEEAIPYMRRAQAQHDRWADLIRRLPASGLLLDDDALIDHLVEQMVED